ncbi:MAG: efflux RND transporter permease subunit [Vicinamibacterales bacterium]
MHKLAELCVRRPVFATMLIVSLTVMGIYSYIGLGVDYFPNIDIPTVAITVNNPGASAEQIETEITKKVEGAVNTISGISELRSTSSEGSSMVIVTFVLEKNGDVAAQEVRDKVNLLAGQLPETAKAPIILKADPGATPVMQLTVAGNRPLREVTRFAEKNVKERLESINGVGQVSMVGDTKRAIQIRLDPDKMRAYGVTVPEVVAALRSQNLTLPGGRVEQGALEVTLRTMGKITDPAEFNGIAIANRGDYVVRLKDIGSVEDGQAEMRTAAFFNGKPAVLLTVTKQSGQNTVTVAADLKRRIAAIQESLPSDMTLRIVDDQAMFTEAALGAVKEHLVLGSILASAVIFFFLANIRTTLIAAVAIPTSIISTFFLMAVMGYTLNVVTMLALTLMVGVVIDDAIIVLENIYRYIEEKGMAPFEAAIKGTKEIGFAVLATTLSLMAVFVPVAFMGGIVGRVLASFGLTAAFAVGVSLLVSYTLTPMLTSRFVKPPRREDIEAHHGSKDSIIFRPIEKGYMAMLRWAMAHRWAVVGLCVLVIASIVPLFNAIGKNFAPDEDRSKLTVNIRAPEGTGLAATTTIIERIAADLRKLPEVQDTLVSIGSAVTGMGPGMVTGASAGNVGSITVALTPIEQRTRTQFDLMPVFRQLLAGYPDLRTSVLALGGPGGGVGVQFSLRGPDLARLGEYADDLYARIRKNPRAVDVDTSLVYGKPELRVEINRQRAADLGVRVQDIANSLNVLVGGQNVTTFDVGEDQYDVTLRAVEGFRTTAEGVQRMTVPSSKRGVVDISEVVNLIPSTGPSSIERADRQRQVTLSANLAGGASQSELIADIQDAIATMKMDPGYVAEPVGLSEELAKTGVGFAIAISLSFIFMYIVLAAQFESFIHPVTILLTLPLAVPFGILSLFIGGQTVNLFAGLGLLLLFGIVKKNAILQIDHTNGLREEGLPRYEAILQANRERLRPILMTTIALVAGMIPLIVADGAGSSTNKTIGVLVVGGQMLCLLLTLLAVPVFYSLFDDFEQWPALSRFAAAVRRILPFGRRRDDAVPTFQAAKQTVAPDHAE